MAARRRRVPAGYVTSPDAALRAALACDNRIVADICARFERYGSLSPKQAALVLKIAAEDASRKADYAARAAKLAASGVAVPTGSTRVVGTVVVVKWKEGFYPGYKWLVEADAGWRVWGTVPAALVDGEPLVVKGDRVAFKATIKASDDDAAFGFAGRPSQAEILPSPARAVAGCVAALGALSRALVARDERRRRDEAAAVCALVTAMARYWSRDARTASAAVRAMGRWYGGIYGRCQDSRCYGGWVRWYSTEYPCGTCAKLRERRAAWEAKLAPFREVAA